MDLIQKGTPKQERSNCNAETGTPKRETPETENAKTGIPTRVPNTRHRHGTLTRYADMGRRWETPTGDANRRRRHETLMGDTEMGDAKTEFAKTGDAEMGDADGTPETRRMDK